MTTRQRAAGRPRVGDPELISSVGLRLITENGWSNTTMADIAKQCGVSAPTLFRYFPTKASLLWYGMEQNAALFRESFWERKSRQDLPDAIIDGFLTMLHSTEHLALIKSRMAVIVGDGEASQATWATHEQWRALVISFAAEYRGEPADSLAARVIGASIWATLWAAITAWALSDEPDPTYFITAARELISFSD